MKNLGVIISYEGHSYGTVIDDNIDFFLPNFDLFYQCFSLDCPFYAASKSDSVIRFLPSFLKFVFFFFK